MTLLITTLIPNTAAVADSFDVGFSSHWVLTHHGYEVTRYLYAINNIILPNFFKRSQWSKMWSNKANWIGYVAISNNEITKCLGHRDITIAWRGTVTRLEWIADLMDFLKPVNGNKIPCREPTMKVESGFLDLYTDKEVNCRFCKFSTREQILTEVKQLTERINVVNACEE
ncbi:hypothetical protein RCOM_1514850 [Ricinus communis]|uniref:Fungal lipase-type domain-containing protein n=1 Tax=Ricinus communis TaxID=3988 RepID=B9R990_RICCO|nr:hypothetical protein RCOM_1514850 [Ricinus communis]